MVKLGKNHPFIQLTKGPACCRPPMVPLAPSHSITPSSNIIVGTYYDGSFEHPPLIPKGFIWYPTDTTPKSFPPPSASNQIYTYYIPQSASKDGNTIIGICGNNKITIDMGLVFSGYIFNYTLTTNSFIYYYPPEYVEPLPFNLFNPQIISHDGSTIFGYISSNDGLNFKLNSDFKSNLINLNNTPYNIPKTYTTSVSKDGTISVGNNRDTTKGYMLNGEIVTYPVSFTDMSGSYITSITSDGKTYVGVCVDDNRDYLYAFKNDTKISSITNVSFNVIGSFNILISPDGSTVVWIDDTNSFFKQINDNTPIKINTPEFIDTNISLSSISEDGGIISGNLFISLVGIKSFRIIGNKFDILDKPSVTQGSS